MNGAELWTIRIALGLTPAKLSNLIGMNARNITRWEQREEQVPDWVADRVTHLYTRRQNLAQLIWDHSVDKNGALDVLVLLNREEDLPDYVPDGTTVHEWNNAIVALYDEAAQFTDPAVEWNRYTEAG